MHRTQFRTILAVLRLETALREQVSEGGEPRFGMANERDGLKKKIIESVKRERKRSRFDDEEDEEDSSSSFFVLS
jgi:hypothetical protein